MPGFEDPRFLQDKIEALERKVASLEASTLSWASNQKGALPGQFRANMIGDPGLASSMFLNLMGNLVGSAPRLSVTDATNTTRVELGNLAANGLSPAQFGMRANDASGNPIFDSLGLIAVMTSAGLAAGASSQTIAAGAGFTDITGSSFTITTTRQQRVLYMISTTGYLTAAGAGNSTQIRGSIVGFNNSASIFQGDSNIDTSFIWYYSAAMPAGTYTVKLQASPVGSAWNCTQYFHQVFLPGT